MNQIEIIGMRRNRDFRIVITIIILAIIGILVCSGIIIYNKYKALNAVASVEENTIEAVNNEKNVAEENEIKDGENSTNPDNKEFISAIENIYNGKEGKRVFLTFDDGPSKDVTPHILDILDKYNIKATFFVLGNRVKMYPDIVKQEYEAGHYIANHGYSHKYSSIYNVFK